jgi:hypothetical protein
VYSFDKCLTKSGSGSLTETLSGSFFKEKRILRDNLPNSCSTILFPVFIKVKLLSEKERRRQVLINNPRIYKSGGKVNKNSSL